eukprot:TRINITY_DN3880_c0_g1_i1.p1 TRINITY_DN3880_c0_g1~~TRINITY_DN3880_c0_g1_i1.p1  ORF type:complete len:138 (-),score=49.96 TRINITY_DN3880_c0_g1_i1:42-455(-)
MALKGPAGGAENNMYRKGYEFFEKLRIFTKKPKSAARKKSEETFINGMEQVGANRMRVIVRADSLAPTQMQVMLARARAQLQEIQQQQPQQQHSQQLPQQQHSQQPQQPHQQLPIRKVSNHNNSNHNINNNINIINR